MNEEQRQTFKEEVLKLPLAVQRAILDSDWEEKVIKIGQSHKLYYSQIDSLITETAVVLSGLATPAEFHHNLIDAIETDKPETIADLVREINLMVFKPIHEEVQASTEAGNQQFVTSETEQQQPRTENQSTPQATIPSSAVFKVVSEKYEEGTDSSKPAGDPYQEPIN